MVLAVSCGSHRAGDTHANTFRSPVYGYAIDLPAEWSAIPATEQLAPGQPPLTGPPITDVIAPRPDRRVSKMRLPALVIGAQHIDESVTLDEWATTVEGVVDRQKQCGGPQRREHTRVGTQDALLLSYPDCPKGAHLDHYWVAVVEGGRGFHLVLFDTAGNEAADRQLLQRLLSSVAFTG